MVVIERGAGSFGAYVPDLPNCIAAAETAQEVLQLIHEAIEFHLGGIREEGAPVPQPLFRTSHPSGSRRWGCSPREKTPGPWFSRTPENRRCTPRVQVGHPGPSAGSQNCGSVPARAPSNRVVARGQGLFGHTQSSMALAGRRLVQIWISWQQRGGWASMITSGPALLRVRTS